MSDYDEPVTDALSADGEENDAGFSSIKMKLEDVLDTPAKPVTTKSSLGAGNTVCSDHMRVYLRVRPLTEEEINKGENQVCIR